MNYLLTQHAKDVLEERKIRMEWLERALIHPKKIEDDPLDDELEHYLGIIDEYGYRVLRVVCSKEIEPLRVVTVYFDRTMKGKL